MTPPSPAKSPIVINAQDITTLTARLAQVLAEEVDYLEAMKVREIEKLQEEKLFLIDAMETYRRLFKKHPELSETIPSQDKHDLKQMVDVFQTILDENHRKLQMAKEVNTQVVKAIREVVTEKGQTPYYGSRGMKHMAMYEHHSVTLNQQV